MPRERDMRDMRLPVSMGRMPPSTSFTSSRQVNPVTPPLSTTASSHRITRARGQHRSNTNMYTNTGTSTGTSTGMGRPNMDTYNRARGAIAHDVIPGLRGKEIVIDYTIATFDIMLGTATDTNSGGKGNNKPKLFIVNENPHPDAVCVAEELRKALENIVANMSSSFLAMYTMNGVGLKDEDRNRYNNLRNASVGNKALLAQLKLIWKEHKDNTRVLQIVCTTSPRLGDIDKIVNDTLKQMLVAMQRVAFICMCRSSTDDAIPLDLIFNTRRLEPIDCATAHSIFAALNASQPNASKYES